MKTHARNAFVFVVSAAVVLASGPLGLDAQTIIQPVIGTPTVGTTSSGIVWSDYEGAVTITGYNGNSGTVVIPDAIGGDPVIAIQAAAFQGSLVVSSITIPSSLGDIGVGAFSNCTNLATVAFTGTGSTMFIDDSAFQNCTSLTGIDIPASVVSLGSYAFQGCTSLASVTIPNSVTSIGVQAFEGCTSLSGVILPSGLTSLANEVFAGCTSIKGITIPSTVVSIGSEAFAQCGNLSSVTFSSPSSVASIGILAFENCSSLTSITIPGSVTSIGEFAFGNCSSLAQIHFLGNAPTVDPTAFQGASSSAISTYELGMSGWGSPIGGLASAAVPAVRLVNISTRAQVGSGANVLIAGFVVSGSGAETLLIRGDGPSLAQYGVTGFLAAPTLSVFNSDGVAIASNTGWGTNPNPNLITSTAKAVGAFSLPNGSADSALIVSLPAGAYTAEVSGMNNSSGVALVEVYEVSSTGTRLVNISSRAQVGTGENIVIPGFVVTGSGSETLLVRGDGPALTQFGVSGVLAQPSIILENSSGSTVGANTGWTSNADPSLITSTDSEVGAFALGSTSADSALVTSTQSGAFTLQVSGAEGETGVVLAEVYEVP